MQTALPIHRLHLFNPGSETAVLVNRPHYTPPANVALMRRDLACLPLSYADEVDCVLSASVADTLFAANLPDLLHPFAKVVTSCSGTDRFVAEPWGISPDSADLFRHTLCAGSDLSGLTLPAWMPEWRRLVSRETAAECLRRLDLPDKPDPPLFMDDAAAIVSYVCHGSDAYILKEPFSSSGRGLLWLERGAVSAVERRWIEGALKRQGQISIEKRLDKKLDFAMEFASDGVGGICFLGLSLFHTAVKGAYSGNLLSSQAAMEQRIVSLSGTMAFSRTKEEVKKVLGELIGHSYRGLLGVDMMVYLDAKGGCLIHPCVELNLRHTMGTAALSLYQKRISPASEGLFAVSYEKQPGEALRLHEQMTTASPLIIRQGRINSGYLSLCPVNTETHYRAFLTVHDSAVFDKES